MNEPTVATRMCLGVECKRVHDSRDGSSWRGKSAGIEVGIDFYRLQLGELVTVRVSMATEAATSARGKGSTQAEAERDVLRAARDQAREAPSLVRFLEGVR